MGGVFFAYVIAILMVIFYTLSPYSGDAPGHPGFGNTPADQASVSAIAGDIVEFARQASAYCAAQPGGACAGGPISLPQGGAGASGYGSRIQAYYQPGAPGQGGTKPGYIGVAWLPPPAQARLCGDVSAALNTQSHGSLMVGPWVSGVVHAGYGPLPLNIGTTALTSGCPVLMTAG